MTHAATPFPAAPVPEDPHAPIDFTAASRAALVEALLAAGPGHATLCAGWNTEHLAAHIHLRETSPAALGLLVPPLGRDLERRTLELGDAHATEDGYADLVARVARGPLGAPDSTGGIGDRLRGLARRARRTRAAEAAARQVQLLEFFVHTEDVRRAQERWAPRILAEDYADTLFDLLRGRARLLYREEPGGVVLERTRLAGTAVDVAPVTARKPGRDGAGVVVRGPAGELVMHAFGRRQRALVRVDRMG